MIKLKCITLCDWLKKLVDVQKGRMFIQRQNGDKMRSVKKVGYLILCSKGEEKKNERGKAKQNLNTLMAKKP